MLMKLFCLPRNWIYLLQNSLSSYVYPKGIYKTLKRMGKIQFVSELTFAKSVNFLNFASVFTKKKNCNYQSLNSTLYMRKLTLV